MGCLIEHRLKPEFLCCYPRPRVRPHIGLTDPSRPSTSPRTNLGVASSSPFNDLKQVEPREVVGVSCGHVKSSDHDRVELDGDHTTFESASEQSAGFRL